MTSHRSTLLVVACVVATQLGALPTLYGQASTGTITGAVQDATGAVVPGVTVTLTNPETGWRRDTTSSASGDYTFVFLQPGTYVVEAESPGMQRATIMGIVLQVDQVARVDISMTVGEVTETVEVIADVVALQTDNATLGHVIASKQITELPLNGRQFLQLAALGPGVNPQVYASTSVNFCCKSIAFFKTGQNAVTITANGQREYSNMYLLDGVHNRNPVGGAVAITPSIEALEEFKLQTNSFSAEYGSSPTTVNIVTRGGSNSFHGAIFHFFRNDRLDARNFFDGEVIPPFNQNQFGGVISGPVIKDSTFFMFNFEGQRVRKANTLSGTFATQAMRDGDFSAFPTQIYEPLTDAPIPNNRIPQSRSSQIYNSILPFIPLPNIAGAGGASGVEGFNFRNDPKDIKDSDQWTARLDQRISDFDNLLFRYSTLDAPTLYPGATDLYGTEFIYDGSNMAITEVHTFSPTVINEFRFGFQSSRNFRLAEGNFGDTNYAQDVIGLKNVSAKPSNFGLPAFSVTGLSTVAPNSFTPQGGKYNEYQFMDQLAILRGAHSFKIGGAINQHNYDGVADLNPRGSLAYNGQFTSPDGQPGGVPYADFLLGFPQSASVGQGDSETFLRYKSFHFFITDDWKITSKLSLSLGIRWEYEQRYHDRDDGLNVFDVRVGRVLRARDGEVRNGIMDPDWNNVAARIGLAYRPFGEKTVLRAAYGVFYDSFEYNDIQFMKLNAPDLIFSIFSNPLINPANHDTWFPDPGDSFFAPFGVNVENATPYYQHWNFAVQRELASNLFLEVAYVGSKGTKLPGRFNANQAYLDKDPNTPTPVDSRRRFEGFGDAFINSFDRTSSYNSLQTKLERRFAQGLSLLAAYTWGRTLDSVSSSAYTPVDIGCISCEWGLSDLHVKHRFTFSSVYELPFGRGRAYLSSLSGAADALLGGWQVNGIVTLSSGLALSPGGGNSNTGGFVSNRPNVVGGCDPNDFPQGTVQQYFNPGCFFIQQTGTFGNSGRNVILGPGINNVDFSLFKNFPFAEGNQQLQFRAEFFNFFNHPSFVDLSVNTNIASGNAGLISTARDGRVVQFALKYRF